MPEDGNNSAQGLSVQGLSVKRAGRLVLPPVSFALERGKTLCILGPSGGGKSTLLRAVAALVPHETGTVRWLGYSAEQWGIRSWRARVTLVPQVPPPLAGSLADWVSRVADLSVQRAARTELKTSTQAYAERQGLARERMEAPFATLSGGERQRLFLSLVLASNPEVLLLDEPTGALDAEAKARAEEILSTRTALWVTHDRQQAERIAHDILELGA